MMQDVNTAILGSHGACEFMRERSFSFSRQRSCCIGAVEVEAGGSFYWMIGY